MADITPPHSPARDHYPSTSYRILASGINLRGNQWCRWQDDNGIIWYQYNNQDGTVYNNINDGEFVTYDVGGQLWYQNGQGWTTNPPANVTETVKKEE